jgi:hypothetical protein
MILALQKIVTFRCTENLRANVDFKQNKDSAQIITKLNQTITKTKRRVK